MLTPVDIQNYSLKTSVRGYSKKETDDFLEAILEGYEALYKENHEIKEKITSLSEGIQYYKQMENSMQKALVLAEKTSNEAQEAAKNTADALTNEAQTKAEELTGQAQEKANAVTDQAQSQANSLLSDAQAKADALIAQAQAFSAETRVQADAIVAQAQENANAVNARAQAFLAESQAKADALVNNAQVQANSITSRAQVILAESKAKADSLVGDAQRKAAGVVDEANLRAEDTEKNAKRALREARGYVRDMMRDYENYRVQVKKLVDMQDKLLNRGSVSSLVSDLDERLQYTTQIDQMPEKEEASSWPENDDKSYNITDEPYGAENVGSFGESTPVGETLQFGNVSTPVQTDDVQPRFAGGHPQLGDANTPVQTDDAQPRFAGGHPQLGEANTPVQTDDAQPRFAGGHPMPETDAGSQPEAPQFGAFNAQKPLHADPFSASNLSQPQFVQTAATPAGGNGQEDLPETAKGSIQPSDNSVENSVAAFTDRKSDDLPQSEVLPTAETVAQTQKEESPFVQSQPIQFTQPDGIHFGSVEDELNLSAREKQVQEESVPVPAESDLKKDVMAQEESRETLGASHPKDDQIQRPELDPRAIPLSKPTSGFVSPDEVVLRPRFTEDEPKEDEADSLINARMEGYAKSDAESPFTFIDTGK